MESPLAHFTREQAGPTHGAVRVLHESGTAAVARQAEHAGFDHAARRAFHYATGLTGDRTDLAVRHTDLNLGKAHDIPNRIPAADMTQWRTDAGFEQDDRGVALVAFFLTDRDLA